MFSEHIYSLSLSLTPSLSLPPSLTPSPSLFSEALEQLQSELRLWPPGLLVQLSQPFRNVAVPSEILPSLFEGQLASLVSETLCNDLCDWCWLYLLS